MDMKNHILAALRDQLDGWEELLASLSEAQITSLPVAYDRSIKDEIAHLWAWQQITRARLEAAVLDREPQFPVWIPGIDPEAEEVTDPINEWIFETHQAQPWAGVHQNWREGFIQVLELGAKLAEKDLLDASRYAWLEGYNLAFILLATYDHHQEHLDLLVARLEKPS
jgi:hypothetical protein